MSESTFNILMSVIFGAAMLFNSFVVYKIAYSKPLIKQRTIVIDNRHRNQPEALYHIDDDGWKEIRAETV